MLAEGLLALATLAGNTVVTAAVTDAWEAARDKFARLLGSGNPDKTKLAEQWLEETHDQLTAAAGTDLERTRAVLAERWAGRLAGLLEEDPGIEAGPAHRGAGGPGGIAGRDGDRGRSRGGGRTGREHLRPRRRDRRRVGAVVSWPSINDRLRNRCLAYRVRVSWGCETL